MEFGVELEDLKITHSALETIKSHAFKNVRGIRRLDLSENRISQIENDAFTEVTPHHAHVFHLNENYFEFVDRSFVDIVENFSRIGHFNDRFSRTSLSITQLFARTRFKQQSLEFDWRHELPFLE